jgi:OOP family OmpA-OmpF porin
MDWIGAIKFAMGQLQSLGRGTVTLGDKTYAIEGEAASSQAFAAILDTNRKTLPASLSLASAKITPPTASPYRFLAMRQPAGLVLEGYVASEEDRAAILTVARKKFGGTQVVDRLAYAGGAPDGYVEATGVAIQALSRLAAGRAELVNTELALSGGAYHPAAEQEIAEAAVESLPKGYAATAAIRAHQTGQPVAPERCRDLLSAELQAGRIDFDSDKTEVADRSFGMLDRVAAVLQRCPEADIEIASHTDSDGSTARNQAISEARADAIVEYLVDAGVMRERLTAKGYGETKPIADNKTDEGKARNRRIEFTLTVRSKVPPPEVPAAAGDASAPDAAAAPSDATTEDGAAPPADNSGAAGDAGAAGDGGDAAEGDKAKAP